MGVLNVTPDSFSDGGLFVEPAAAVARGGALFEAGADIVDVGGESTRPGGAPMDPEAEIRRVVPVIEGLRRRGPGLVSVDTTKVAVAAAALDAGADLVNDVSGFASSGSCPPGRAPGRARGACTSAATSFDAPRSLLQGRDGGDRGAGQAVGARSRRAFPRR